MTQSFLKSIIPYLKQVRGLLLLGSLGGLVMNTAVVLPAILLGRAIDAAVAWGEGQAAGRDVLWAGLAYAGAMALYQAARLVKRWGLRIGNQRILAALRADALRGVLAWPMERLYRLPIGDLMARIVGDAAVVIRGVQELDTEAWDTVLFSLSLIAGMLAHDPTLTLLALWPAPLGMLLARFVERWVGARTTAAREASADLTAFLQERLSGLRVIRLFGRREATVARAGVLSERLARANLAIIRLRGGLQPVYTLLMMAGIVFVLWLGGERVAAGSMTLGAFIAYLDLYRRFVGRGHRIPQLFNSVQSAAAAYARLEPLLAPPARSGEQVPIPPARGGDHRGGAGPSSLSLQGVAFRYPGSAALSLDGVSLEVPAGSLVAVTGPVGAGKSALARALLGLYPLAGGRILLDGRPLDDLTPAERATRIGYLPQTPFLFSGSVRDNVLMDLSGTGPDRTEALDRCVELAALRDDVDGFPDGLDTQIGERGLRVSGGQRQRIALARAFAASPGLLVLDDPFSSVDVDTEACIIAGLRETFGPTAPLDRRATVVFFSHRLAAFPLADRVVVLDGGRIIEQGAHGTLLQAGGLYARIYRAQQHAGPRAAEAG